MVRVLLALPLVAAVPAWAFFAVQDGIGTFVFDGSCYEPAATWEVIQGALALIGIGFLTRAVVLLASQKPTLGRGALAVAGSAAVAMFIGWCFVMWQGLVSAEKVLCEGQSPLLL